jgi:hypothetical protein
MAANKIITVYDTMQQGYRYVLSEPHGEHFAVDFTPDLTPMQMLELGVFGGVYMRDCTEEFPHSWFDHAKLAATTRQAELNYFGVNASQSLREWQRKGWIYDEDPRGWFQWYCRYYLGRRCPDDTRQIQRWKAIRRHVGQVKAHCQQGDQLCRQKQRQALLHWAYDSRNI